MSIRVGDQASHEFVVDAAAMAAFQALSGDLSRIHTDPAYAGERGYSGVIVYGGIMLAHLSYVLGMQLPGTNGASMRWSIDYRRPLYVGQPARIELEIADVSPGSGVVMARFRIVSDGKTIATGQTQSLLPLDELAP